MTGNSLTCNKKYQQPFDFNPIATWIGSINRYPLTKDKTWGFFRRWITIPFNKSFGTDAQFAKKKKKLWYQDDVLSAILFTCLQKYVEAYREGTYTIPDVAENLADDMHKDANSVITWLGERMQKVENTYIGRKVAYDDYCGFCSEKDYTIQTDRMFYSTLRSRGYDVDKQRKVDGKLTRVIENLTYNMVG